MRQCGVAFAGADDDVANCARSLVAVQNCSGVRGFCASPALDVCSATSGSTKLYNYPLRTGATKE
jgi:hypothetical protein